MQARITTAEGAGEIIIKGSIGKTQVLPAAAAVAAALALGATLPEALDALGEYEPPAGRGRVFAGSNSTTLIDDSYNASPAAVEEALATLKSFPRERGRGRKIAVLGDMLELGRYSVAEHERIGALAAHAADVVISVGIRARALAESARAANHHDCAFSYDNAAEAALALASYIEPGDVILVKGSQSIRMERIALALLADPADISKLVRQEGEWKKR
jgi:UDP-N-acetylmuramoyl-tripeptide--D-alanyl-D-alanine ligase